MNQPWIYMCSPFRSPLLPPFPSHPSGSSQWISPEHLSHASNLGWRSVSPLIVYLFQCCSLRTAYPCLLPQSLTVCSVFKIELWHFCYWVVWVLHMFYILPEVSSQAYKDSQHWVLYSLVEAASGLPWWLRWQSICLQCRRPGFNPWVGKNPWRRKWPPTPVLLPGKFD